jgi:hypothetical protein
MLRYAALQAEALEVQNARDALFFSLGKLTQVSGEYFQPGLSPCDGYFWPRLMGWSPLL